MSQKPIACTLTADDFRARLAELLPSLRNLAGEVRRRDDGIVLRFAPSTVVLQHLAHVIDTERQCCQFLQFRITVEPDLGPIWLEVTGPPGTAELLSALVGS